MIISDIICAFTLIFKISFFSLWKLSCPEAYNVVCEFIFLIKCENANNQLFMIVQKALLDIGLSSKCHP